MAGRAEHQSCLADHATALPHGLERLGPSVRSDGRADHHFGLLEFSFTVFVKPVVAIGQCATPPKEVERAVVGRCAGPTRGSPRAFPRWPAFTRATRGNVGVERRQAPVGKPPPESSIAPASGRTDHSPNRRHIEIAFAMSAGVGHAAVAINLHYTYQSTSEVKNAERTAEGRPMARRVRKRRCRSTPRVPLANA